MFAVGGGKVITFNRWHTGKKRLLLASMLFSTDANINRPTKSLKYVLLSIRLDGKNRITVL